MASQPNTCVVCSAQLDHRNRSGYCCRHNNASPEKRRKISESLKRANQMHPEWRTRRSEAVKRAAKDPANRARRAELCRERRLWEYGVAGHTPESRARVAATQSANRMAWCPPHLRAEAKRLSQTYKMPAAQVRSIILEQHEMELRRFRRSIGVEPEPLEFTGPPAATFLERASIIAAQWAGVTDIWARNLDRRVVKARWAIYLALRRGGWSNSKIARETGRERKGVMHGLPRAEILAAAPGEFADLFHRIVAA